MKRAIIPKEMLDGPKGLAVFERFVDLKILFEITVSKLCITTKRFILQKSLDWHRYVGVSSEFLFPAFI